MKSPIQLFAAIAILLATATVAAQVYKWVDKDGKVQYSDQPPPASATKTEAKKVETSPVVAPVANQASTGQTIQERAKEYDKRQKDAAEKIKKDADAQKNAEIEDANCKAAKAALRDMESGRPIKRPNDQGEPVFMTDEERLAEAAKARALAAKSCKD